MEAELTSDDPENSPAASKECPHCATMMPESAAFCPACGWSMTPLPVTDRVVACAAYFTLIPAAIILLLPRFRDHRYVRFHAWQSVLLWGVFFLLAAVALFFSNVESPMALLLFGLISILGMVFLWIVLSVKAWQGERFALPLFGNLAGLLK